MTIHDQIEARPLSHILPNNSKPIHSRTAESDLETSSQSSDSVAGDLEVSSPGLVGDLNDASVVVGGEEEEEDEMEMGAVLRNDDRELDRIFKVSS